MRRLLFVAVVAFFAVMAVHVPSNAFVAQDAAGVQYEVLSPWAEVDPIPLRGISPRVDTLAGKKIGLFANFKRASRPILASVEKRLRSMYPNCETSLFDSDNQYIRDIKREEAHGIETQSALRSRNESRY